MDKKRYIYNVYNFLNNTRGEIADYEIIELLKTINFEKEDSYKVTQEDITYLSNLLMSGDNEEEFYNYLIEKERGTN